MTSRKHAKPAPPHTHHDGTLQLAITTLTNAIHALCDPQPHPLNTGRTWLDSRYQQLRDAISTASVSGHNSSTPASLIPAQIDALKLTITIDTRTAIHVAHWENQLANTTPARLQQLTDRTWRPQDTQPITNTATEIQSWTKAINDLFAPKPLYLPDPCPHCHHTHAYRLNDEGERVRTPALTVTAARGAYCAHCHDIWPPDQLLFLGRILGYRTEGINE